MIKVRFTQVLVNIFFVCALMPFVAPIPFHTDVQYPVFIFGLLVFIVLIYKEPKLDILELLFLFLGLLSAVYINVFSDISVSMHKYLTVALSFVCFINSRRFCNLYSVKVFKFVIYFNLLVMVFQLFMPDIFSKTLGVFIRIVKITEFSGARGVSGFAAEPGLMGGVIVFYMLLIMYFFQDRLLCRNSIHLLVICLLMVVLTKSGTGYLYAFIVICYIFIYHARILGAFVFTFLGLSLIFISDYNEFFGSNRGMDIFVKLSTNIDEFYNDRSVFIRLESLIYGFNVLLGHPLGIGIGEYNAFIENNNEMISGSISALGTMIAEMGVFFVVFIVTILIMPSNFTYSLLYKLFILLYLCFSYSFAFPPIWLLLGIVYSNIKFIIRNQKIVISCARCNVTHCPPRRNQRLSNLSIHAR